MPDELDAQLLRWFAESQEDLTDAQFPAQVTARLGSRRGRLLGPFSGRAILFAVFAGLATGIAAPLRLRHARLMALGTAVLTVWVTLQAL